jgi:hypothetical protein
MYYVIDYVTREDIRLCSRIICSVNPNVCSLFRTLSIMGDGINISTVIGRCLNILDFMRRFIF